MKIKLFVLVMVLLFSTTVHAGSDGVMVNARVEGDKDTICQSTVYAYTFKEALQKLDKLFDARIVFVEGQDSSEVYSVGKLRNKTYDESYAWNGYLVRDGKVIEPSKYLDQNLMTGDEVVLYYGSFSETKKVASPLIKVTSKGISMNLTASYVSWEDQNGVWVSRNIIEPIESAIVHLDSPKKSLTKTTNSEGSAEFVVDAAGVYTLYAEHYTDTVPQMVKTIPQKYLLGIGDTSALTREEVVAILFDFSKKSATTSTQKFSDTQDSKYASQIDSSFASGLISGYPDGSFKPTDKISLAQAYTLAYKFLKYDKSSDSQTSGQQFGNAPDWSKDAISYFISKKIIQPQPDYLAPLTGEALLDLLQ